MRTRKLLTLVLITLPLVLGIFLQPYSINTINHDRTRTVDLGNGMTIEVGPDETLEAIPLSELVSKKTGIGDALIGSEYGARTDSFAGESMYYDSSASTIQTANLSVPLGEDWESYKVQANVTSVTENRTWVENSGFDDSGTWTYTFHDEPKTYPSTEDNSFTSTWDSDGHGTGDGAPFFEITGYYYNAGGGLYGDWYDPGDKAYVYQNLTIDRGDITWMGISLDYWANCGGWGSYMTGFFELFVSVGDPDDGGTYLWDKQFDAIADDETWYSTGFIEVDPADITLPDLSLWAGLRVATLEWYRPDIRPQGMLDNILVYIKAKATPEDVNLKMNGEDVNNILDGGNPVFGLGTSEYTPINPWDQGAAYANFSWTPTPNPPDPDFDVNVDIDVDVTAYARRHNVLTTDDTETFDIGDNYQVENSTDVLWDTNFYVAVPGGYSSQYYFNLSVPLTRDVDFVAQPTQRTTNLTSGWSYGDYGDGLVNVTVFEITQTQQNGFWRIKGSSPNIISTIEVWDDGLGQWTRSKVFRADESTRFRATLSSTYENDIVNFTVYDPSEGEWISLQATVDSSGYATTSYVNLDADNASVGAWQVQGYVSDYVSSGSVSNIGYFCREFELQHSTDMAVQYPVGSETSWTKNVTYGDLVLLQFRVNDSDNGERLSGGLMTYTWTAGSGTVNDLGTGEYSITLDTGVLASNGQYPVDLEWTKDFYDSLSRVFTLNVIYSTELLSPDAPGIDVPSGYDGEITLEYRDQNDQAILDADIVCNWTLDDYSSSAIGGSPGFYLLSLETDNVPLDTYILEINVTKEFCESRTIYLSIQVRELFTSAIPSTSQLSLPVGYSSSFTVTYTDTDHNTPITGAASSIVCNWSDFHEYGEENYTVVEISPGIYEVTLFSEDLDDLGDLVVIVDVERFGSQNHTFTVDVTLRTHLTSFYLVDPVDPTAYTADIEIHVVYYDVDEDVGIANGTLDGNNVRIRVESSLPSTSFTVVNGSFIGEYIIYVPASQWGSIGDKSLSLFVNWTGPTVKYTNETLSFDASVTATPTDIFLGDSPVMTPFGENMTFSIIYYDVANETGIVNSTGSYPDNVHIYITVLTTGETITQQDMVITEIDASNNPGEYQIEFNTSLLSGLVGLDLRIWMNWTKGQLPLYENSTLLVTVYSTYRQTTVDWNPLPITPYDELVNLSLFYRDVLSSSPILNDSVLSITIQESISYTIFYDGDATGEFKIEIDTASWDPGTHEFNIDITWSGQPFYQNRSDITILITVRYRYTELTHGSYESKQYGNNLTLEFTYTDLDDFTSIGMQGGLLFLDSSLTGYYDIADNGDGTYTLELRTDVPIFTELGTYRINATIVYGGSRRCENASDYFYLTLVVRRTQLTSDLPDLSPFGTLSNITVTYIDDNTGQGIESAGVFAFCDTSAEALEEGVNYWIVDVGSGEYEIRIDTLALGNFGSYSIEITANWTGTPFYRERTIYVDIEVSRRPASITVSKSPLSTPFLQNVSFEITVSDGLNGSSIAISKSNLILSHGMSTLLSSSEFSMSGTSGTYTISINSTILTTNLVNDYPIYVKMFWGDFEPFYDNETTSTEVTIRNRFTQFSVLSSPPAFYYFNTSTVVKYNDYLSGDGIANAAITVHCLNISSIQYWVFDNSDGTYVLKINTTGLGQIGKYLFEANASWSGTPFYQNRTRLQFVVTVNPVSTVLSFKLPQSTVYYLGDQIVANVSFKSLETGTGISDANIGTNWGDLYGTYYEITELGGGIYRLLIETSGLDAQSYTFNINGTKYLHINKTITVDILLAALPVEIDLILNPSNPLWGDIVQFDANVTDARNGDPILLGNVNLTLFDDTYEMTEIGGGIYRYSLSTEGYDAGLFTATLSFKLANFESRQRDFQVLVRKLDAILSGSVTPTLSVNGQTVTLRVFYEMASNSSPIDQGTIEYSWTGGNGNLTWNPVDSRYDTTIGITSVPVGSHQILIQATSPNFKSVNLLLTLEIRESHTEVVAYNDTTVLRAVSGETVNVTVYLNNTDLDQPVQGANMTYSIGSVFGNLTDIGDGYYSVDFNTTGLEIRDWILTISSSIDGYTPASVQFTVEIEKIPTDIIIGSALVEGFYGENITLRFDYWDIFNGIGIVGANSTFVLETVSGELFDWQNGTYTLTVNSSVVNAGSLAHDVSVTFNKETYAFAFSTAKLLVKPITTTVIGVDEVDFPVGDDWSLLFTYSDLLHDQIITDGTATAIWEFGTDSLTSLGNGSYRFGPEEAGDIDRLNVRSEPYTIRISIVKGNYSRSELVVQLRVREIQTEIRVELLQDIIYAGESFIVRLTYFDLDHNQPVSGATNSSVLGGLIRDYELDQVLDNGTYILGFTPPATQAYEFTIIMDAQDYESSEVSLVVFPQISPQQQFITNTISYMALGILALAGFAALWFRVLSVPKMLRWLRSMVSSLSKGKIPEPAATRDRRKILLDAMNEDLEPVHIVKTEEDVALSTVDVSVMDVEELLDELAVVVGLTKEDIDILRRDLSNMRPSERAGFVYEVIKQERSRRAQELAAVEAGEVPSEEGVAERKLTGAELENLREQLVDMGIEESEVEIMIEQAKSLTKAEIDALLDQLGGADE